MMLKHGVTGRPAELQRAALSLRKTLGATKSEFRSLAGSLISEISSQHPTGIVSDWKGQRDSFHDDAKLLGRAFAFIYVGSIVDKAVGDPISDELHKELVTDMSSALDARQTAVDWGVVEATTDTNPFAHTGYKLASRLLRTDQPLIEALTRELTSQGTIQGDTLRKWLDANASPLDFDGLEANSTY